MKHNRPKRRKYGKSTKKCILCGNPKGHIGKYHLNLCRRCFRESAYSLGFKKYR